MINIIYMNDRVPHVLYYKKSEATKLYQNAVNEM